MKKALIGKKIGMTQFTQNDGVVTPVTVCELGPCVVIQKKTQETDGYGALKLGYQDTVEKHLSKSISKDLKDKNLPLKKVFREVQIFDDALEVGSTIDCNIFTEGSLVNVTGTSKGKGYAGVIKRHGFGGGRKTHGSHFHRAPGSVGACAYPGEVWKGKKLPGHLGVEKVTIKNLKIMKIFQEENIVLISGAVPGRKGSYLIVREK